MSDQGITILLAVVGFLVTIFLAFVAIIFKILWSTKTQRTEAEKAALGEMSDAIKEITKRLNDIDRQILTLDFPVKLLWAKAEQKLSSDLHMPHEQYKEMDDLLIKLDNRTISLRERKRLKELAEERLHDFSKEITDEHRESAAALGSVMDKNVTEEGLAGPPDNVEVVGEKKSQEPGME